MKTNLFPSSVLFLALAVAAPLHAGVAGITSPGSNAYPNGGLSMMGGQTLSQEYTSNSPAPLLDSANGYAYYLTSSNDVVKVAMGSAATAPVRVSGIHLAEETGGNLEAGAIDTLRGYAYFVIDAAPGRIVKVSLEAGDAAPRKVAVVTMNTGENNPRAIALDMAAGYFYATATSGGIGTVVKYAIGNGDAVPARLNATPFNSGELAPNHSLEVDATTGHLYAMPSEFSGTTKLIKFRLPAGTGAPVRLGATTVNGGGRELILDRTHHHAFVPRASCADTLYKIDLGAGDALPTVLGGLSVSPDCGLIRGGIDEVAGIGYFISGDTPQKIRRISLGVGSALPTSLGTTALLAGESSTAMAFDQASSTLYLSSGASSGIYSLKYGISGSVLTRVGTGAFHPAVSYSTGMAVDGANGYAYLTEGQNIFVGDEDLVAKVRIGIPGTKPQRVSWAPFASPFFAPIHLSSDFPSPYIFAFCGSDNANVRVAKIAVNAGDAAPTILSYMTSSQDDGLPLEISNRAAIDTAAGYGYYLSYSSPLSRLVKFSLGVGAGAMSRIGSVDVPSTDGYADVLEIDRAAQRAYVLTDASPKRLVKFDISGAGAPVRISHYDFSAGDTHPISLAIDPVNNRGYVGTLNSPDGRIVKLDLGTGLAAPTRIGQLDLIGERASAWPALDLASGVGYFSTNGTSPHVVESIALGAPGATPTRIGSAAFPFTSVYTGGGWDAANSVYYIASYESETIMQQFGSSLQGAVRGTKVNLPDPVIVQGQNFYSHTASGNLRLGLYADGTPLVRTWEGPATSNVVANGWVNVPTTAGSPAGVALDSGNYWLTWQSDSGASVASYSAGSAGDGFAFAQPFGSHPSNLAATDYTLTADRFSQYLDYLPAHRCDVTSPFGTPSPAVGRTIIEAGTTVNASVDSTVAISAGTRQRCTGFTGTGSAPASGVTNAASFSLSADAAITWSWQLEHSVTITSPYGTPVPPAGMNWLTPGATTVSTTEFVSGTPGTRYACTGWTGGTGSFAATGSGFSFSANISGPSGLTWTYNTQHDLASTSAPAFGGIVTLGDGVTAATGYLDETPTLIVKATAAPGYEFQNWSGDLSSTNFTETLTFTQPRSITANFALTSTVTDWWVLAD